METVYLIKCREFYKIGITTGDVWSRYEALQTGNPYRLELVDCYEFPNAALVEKTLHRMFANSRELGEWFKLTEDGVRRVRKACLELGGVRKNVRVRNPEEPYLYAMLVKVALGSLVKAGLVKCEIRNGKMLFDFDMSHWTEKLELK